MSKLRQKHLAFKTAESMFNKRKVNLANEFSNELSKAIKADNMERFEILGKEMVEILGEEYGFTVNSIRLLYKQQWKGIGDCGISKDEEIIGTLSITDGEYIIKDNQERLHSVNPKTVIAL